MGEAKWTQAQALELCRRIEALSPDYGCHVALTGGLLYKDGPRKDADILFYRIRQVDVIDTEGLFAALATIGLEKVSGFGWCVKATFEGRKVDCFFPEEEGEYPSDEEGVCQAPGCFVPTAVGICDGCLEWVESEVAALAREQGK